MSKRKDFLNLEGSEVDFTGNEISHDFSGNQAELQYCQELFEKKGEVILMNSKYQRVATVSSIQDEIVVFKMKDAY